MNRKYLISGIIVLLVVVFSAIFLMSEKKDEFETAKVEVGDLVQEVSITGKVEPNEQVDLSFEISGRVESIYFDVGDHIEKGDTVVSLSISEALAEVEEAKAKLKTEELKLEDLKLGAREEDIKIKKDELNKAKQDLENLYGDIQDVLNNAVAITDDVLDKQIDNLFVNDDTSYPKLTFVTSNKISENESETQRIIAGEARKRIKLIVSTVGSDDVSKEKVVNDIKLELNKIKTLLDKLNETLSSATGLSSSDESTYKGNLNTARTNINGVISDSEDIIQSISSQKIVIDRAESELALTLAGKTESEILIQEAIVEQSKASLKRQEAKFLKTKLKAPFSGIVTKQELNVGEIVQTQSSVVSIIGDNSYQIKANVPEADIAIISLFDTARVTLDAFESDREFSASVISIDPAETIVEGVATYKITLEFLEHYNFLKSGMTANIDIKTEEKKGVLYVPSRAIQIKDGQRYIRIPSEAGGYTEVLVTTGLRDSFGNTEILSGLKEGDEIITFISE